MPPRFPIARDWLNVAGRFLANRPPHPEMPFNTRALVLATLCFLLPVGISAANLTEFIWSGAVTPGSVRVKTRLLADSTQVRLVVSTSYTLSNPVYSAYAGANASSNDRVADLSLSGLSANTVYHYAIESAGQLDDRRGTFRTFPSGAASFKIVFGACAGNSSGDNGGGSASNHPVFDHLRNEGALFYLNAGDLHYTNIAGNDVSLFRSAYKTLFTASRQRALYESVPLVYMWDDHDFGPNDSDSTSPARPAARTVYQEYIPHYPLAAGTGQVPNYQTFSVGRVKFILADQRSEKSLRTNADNASKTVLGAAQKTWLKQQLLDGRDHYLLTLWVGSFPWIGTASSGDDSWLGYTTERAELANFIKDNAVTNLVMLAGDAHMVAADDGTNNNYATGGGGGFPVLHAAALHRNGSTKGGPYNQGSFPNPDASYGQYGVLEIVDTGGNSLAYTFTGKRVTSSGSVSTLLTYTDQTTGTGSAPQPFVPFGDTWKYNDSGTNLGTAWRAVSYSDSPWSTGPAAFGYGDPVATTVGYGPDPDNKYPTTYFRRAFTVANPASVESLTLELRRDDGAVAYLNGTEIARSNLPSGTISYSTYASSVVGDSDETAIFSFTVDPALLVGGTNVLAVELHQCNAGSSDLSFDARLLAQISTSAAQPVLSPGDPVIGGQKVGTNFVQGTVGTGSGNRWPAAEAPAKAIDGAMQSSKYLNFGKTNTGFVVTPDIGDSVVTALHLFTANDTEARDPASYELYGTNTSPSGGTMPLSGFTLISSGTLSLPAARNNDPGETFGQSITFSNTTSYTSYLILFPTIKNPSATTSMQIGDVQLVGTVAPPPVQLLFSPGDPVIGGQKVGTNFVQGTVGTGSGNRWPSGEAPAKAIDGLMQSSKYLNFGETNTGFVVTPSAGASVVTSLNLYVANDTEARDPASYELYGTNTAPAGGTMPLSNFTLIASGTLSLPAARNNDPGETFGQTVTFSNATSYTSYLIVFPTIKNASATTSMQIGDVQLVGTVAAPAAQVLFWPGDPVIGGQKQSTNFVEGTVGTGSGNRWPAAEAPAKAIDGLMQSSKYLNFGQTNTGFVVTPSVGDSVVTALHLFTANDTEARDPASYELYGTNTTPSGGTMPMSGFTLISSGSLSLPAARNNDPGETFGQSITINNTTPYKSYLLVFPTIKNPSATPSMQIGDVQFEGIVMP